jgi:hypothetical protein
MSQQPAMSAKAVRQRAPVTAHHHGLLKQLAVSVALAEASLARGGAGGTPKHCGPVQLLSADINTSRDKLSGRLQLAAATGARDTSNTSQHCSQAALAGPGAEGLGVSEAIEAPFGAQRLVRPSKRYFSAQTSGDERMREE